MTNSSRYKGRRMICAITPRRWPEREECDPLDVGALDRCIDQARRDERGLDSGHYDRLLKERQWYDVAQVLSITAK